MADVNIHGGISHTEVELVPKADRDIIWFRIQSNDGDKVVFFVDQLDEIESMAQDLLKQVKQIRG
jgi:hypothetical protein